MLLWSLARECVVQLTIQLCTDENAKFTGLQALSAADPMNVLIWHANGEHSK